MKCCFVYLVFAKKTNNNILLSYAFYVTCMRQKCGMLNFIAVFAYNIVMEKLILLDVISIYPSNFVNLEFF